jgi:hypothetical protein
MRDRGVHKTQTRIPLFRESLERAGEQIGTGYKIEFGGRKQQPGDGAGYGEIAPQ